MVLKIAFCIIMYEPILLLLFLLLSLLLCSVNCLLRFVNKNIVISFSYKSDSQMLTIHHSVNPIFLLEGSNFLPNFQKKGGVGLTRRQFLSGVCWEKGVKFFRKVANFALKVS